MSVTLKHKQGQTVVPLTFVGGIEKVAQKAVARAKTFLGEWEFDIEAGVDWIGFSNDKSTGVAQVSAALKSELEAIPQVERVQVQPVEDREFDLQIVVSDNVEDGGIVNVNLQAGPQTPAVRIR